MRKEGKVTIYERDIATIEAMHDKLFDHFDWPLDSALLKSSRNLTSRMYKALRPERGVCLYEANLKISAKDLDTLIHLTFYTKDSSNYFINRTTLLSKFKNALS